jgi:hypothetical protein
VAKQSLKIFYDILKSAQFKTDEIQFSYIHKNIQSDFVDEIAKKYSKLEKSVDNNVFFFVVILLILGLKFYSYLKIIILKRVDDYYMQFELIENDSSNSFDTDSLKKRIKKILRGSDSLFHTSSIPRIMTESDQV